MRTIITGILVLLAIFINAQQVKNVQFDLKIDKKYGSNWTITAKTDFPHGTLLYCRILFEENELSRSRQRIWVAKDTIQYLYGPRKGNVPSGNYTFEIVFRKRGQYRNVMKKLENFPQKIEKQFEYYHGFPYLKYMERKAEEQLYLKTLENIGQFVKQLNFRSENYLINYRPRQKKEIEAWLIKSKQNLDDIQAAVRELYNPRPMAMQSSVSISSINRLISIADNIYKMRREQLYEKYNIEFAKNYKKVIRENPWNVRSRKELKELEEKQEKVLRYARQSLDEKELEIFLSFYRKIYNESKREYNAQKKKFDEREWKRNMAAWQRQIQAFENKAKEFTNSPAAQKSRKLPKILGNLAEDWRRIAKVYTADLYLAAEKEPEEIPEEGVTAKKIEQEIEKKYETIVNIYKFNDDLTDYIYVEEAKVNFGSYLKQIDYLSKQISDKIKRPETLSLDDLDQDMKIYNQYFFSDLARSYRSLRDGEQIDIDKGKEKIGGWDGEINVLQLKIADYKRSPLNKKYRKLRDHLEKIEENSRDFLACYSTLFDEKYGTRLTPAGKARRNPHRFLENIKDAYSGISEILAQKKVEQLNKKEQELEKIKLMGIAIEKKHKELREGLQISNSEAYQKWYKPWEKNWQKMHAAARKMADDNKELKTHLARALSSLKLHADIYAKSLVDSDFKKSPQANASIRMSIRFYRKSQNGIKQELEKQTKLLEIEREQLGNGK